MSEKQRWVTIEYDHTPWIVVIPSEDILPHDNLNTKCECKPDIDFMSTLIVHNSFQERKAVDDAMKKLESHV